MLNDDTASLKSHLKALHDNLAHTRDVDEELQALLHQLDDDIQNLLERRERATAVVPASPTAVSDSYGLAERTQEITARFAAEHPRLEPALRELGRMLANMGI